MKVIEIMAQSAMLLGLGDEFLMLENASAEQESELKENKNIISLFGLSKYAFQELCTNYIPVVASVKIKSNENKIEIKNLTNFIHIQNVKKDGELAKYKIINRNIIFEEDVYRGFAACSHSPWQQSNPPTFLHPSYLHNRNSSCFASSQRKLALRYGTSFSFRE